MTLAELESLFYRSVRASSPPRDIEDVFVGTPQLGAVRRMGIYHSAYWTRQWRTLVETFPHVVKVLGEERFRRLAMEYLARFPGQNAAIEFVGERFAGFAEARRADLPGAVPWLARLEWARTESLLAPDAECVVRRESLFGRDLSLARAQFAPHVRVLRVPRSTLSFVAGDTSGGESGAVLEQKVCAVVWRHEHVVRQRAFEDPEGLALESAASGLGFAEVCEAFGDDTAIEVVAAKIGAWVDRGWIARFEEGATGAK